MNKLSKLIAVSVVGLSSSAMAVTFVASANANNFEISGVQAATYNTRRIFLVNTVDQYWEDDNWYIRTWTGSGENITYTKATRLMTDYSQGFYYCDISYANATNGLTLIVRHNATEDSDTWDFEATGNVTIPASGTESVIFVNGNDGETKRRGTSLGTAGMSDGQLAYLLTLYDACSSSNVSGYNSYPQLEADVLDACDDWVLESNTQVGTEQYQSAPVSVAKKVAELEYRYNLNK